MISGILNVNKEVGISSQKCVYLVKKALNIKKVGHTGTLDLEASGVLPIVIGKSTRISNYLMEDKKEYIAEAIFGQRRDTLDYSGEVESESDKVFSREDLEKMMENFLGEIEQIPPMYSALKVNGRKLYDLAKQGIKIERKKRNVKIYSFELLDFSFPKAKFRITCSKGTYIRTLIDDLGEDLGSFAYVSSLKRTAVGPFKIENSINSFDILDSSADDLLKRLKETDFALMDFERIDLDSSYKKQATNGMTMRIKEKNSDKLVRVYCDGEFIGLGKCFESSGEIFLKMESVFYDR